MVKVQFTVHYFYSAKKLGMPILLILHKHTKESHCEICAEAALR